MRQQATPTPAAAAHTYSADEELDLSCDWDAARPGAGRDSLRAYVEKERPHLLRSYDREFLIDAVQSSRARAHGGR
jgi:hypothetical protein